MNFTISDKLVPKNYLKLAQDAQKSKETAVRELLEKRKLPDHGWSDESIEALVQYMASLDSNNFSSTAGLGEREGRIACRLVARRHYNFGHGIGRSGDILETQPKAVGSTLLANLTNALLLDLIRAVGVHSCCSCFLVPLATGMTLTLCLLSLRKQRAKAKYVIWSRIDQKSCFKSITTAGLVPIIVDMKRADDNDGLYTDVKAFEDHLSRLNSEEVLCIVSTTSCFAPRNCDDIVSLAKLAEQFAVPHLVNNAYGLQSTYLTHQLEQAQRVGRIDIFVQSTDKNLMVPVGGAIVAGFDETVVHNVAKTYAGRAPSSQSLDVFMTLLSLGKQGYLEILNKRKITFEYLRKRLQTFAETHQTKVLESKSNPISLALSLETFYENTEMLGSMLFTRGVSGVRVVPVGSQKSIDGYVFDNWGSHHSEANVPYLTVAAAIGVSSEEIDCFFKKLDDCWRSFLKRQ